MAARTTKLVCIAVLAFALAACGSNPRKPQVVSQPQSQCTGSRSAVKRERARKELNADLRRLRAAAATIHGHTQNGNRALSVALERFKIDVAGPTLPVYDRSDFIDHAAAIVSPVCEQCFMDLEANRPVGAGAKLPCD
jgi:hypothetical protein